MLFQVNIPSIGYDLEAMHIYSAAWFPGKLLIAVPFPLNYQPHYISTDHVHLLIACIKKDS